METNYKYFIYKILNKIDFFFILTQDCNITEIFIIFNLYYLPSKILFNII